MYEVKKSFYERDALGQRTGTVFEKGQKVDFSDIEAARYSEFIMKQKSGPERAVKTPPESRGGKKGGVADGK